MKRILLLGAASFLLAGCSLFDAINPFSSSGPKMAELQPIQATVEARVVWQESVGKGEDSVFVPAVVGSSIYAAARDGNIVRLDDGQPVWKVKAEQALSGGVGADERTLVVGTAKGDVLAFASGDGRLLWKAKVGSEVIAPPAVGAGLVIVRSGDHRLTAFNAFDGQRKWIYQRPGTSLSLRTTASPLLLDKYVFAGFPGGKLIAVGVDTGAPLWEGTVALPRGVTELDRIADVTSAPATDGRMICAVAFQGQVACFDLASGNLIWTRDISSAAGLAMDVQHVYVSDDKGVVHALDKTSGASIWKQDKLTLRQLTAPLPRRNLVVVADVQGIVHYLNRDDGAFAARVTTDGSPIAAPLQKLGSNLLVQTRSGRVLAIEVP